MANCGKVKPPFRKRIALFSNFYCTPKMTTILNWIQTFLLQFINIINYHFVCSTSVEQSRCFVIINKEDSRKGISTADMNNCMNNISTITSMYRRRLTYDKLIRIPKMFTRSPQTLHNIFALDILTKLSPLMFYLILI